MYVYCLRYLNHKYFKAVLKLLLEYLNGPSKTKAIHFELKCKTGFPNVCDSKLLCLLLKYFKIELAFKAQTQYALVLHAGVCHI